MEPILLPANQPPQRFYRGGARIAAFRHAEQAEPRTPEDWVASVTEVRGRGPLGLTTLPSGELLRDAVRRDPQAWLGEEHVHRFGADTKLLVKLLDAGQRLPVHAHPDTAFASSHVGTAHGKAEAWYILEPGEVYLGLTRDVAHDELLALVERQDVDTLLDTLHRIPVLPNQTVFVPPGVLHAIGAGILLAEVQEPEDLSILLEWRDFDLDGQADGHLGLGFDTALQAVEIVGRTAAEVQALIGGRDGNGETLVPAADQYFGIQRLQVRGSVRCGRGFAVLIVIDGNVAIATETGPALDAPTGSTVLAPHAAGDLQLSGTGRVIVARPPRAS